MAAKAKPAVIVTLSGERKVRDVARDLRAAGLQVDQVLEETGIVTGTADSGTHARLRKIPGCRRCLCRPSNRYWSAGFGSAVTNVNRTSPHDSPPGVEHPGQGNRQAARDGRFASEGADSRTFGEIVEVVRQHHRRQGRQAHRDIRVAEEHRDHRLGRALRAAGDVLKQLQERRQPDPCGRWPMTRGQTPTRRWRRSARRRRARAPLPQSWIDRRARSRSHRASACATREGTSGWARRCASPMDSRAPTGTESRTRAERAAAPDCDRP